MARTAGRSRPGRGRSLLRLGRRGVPQPAGDGDRRPSRLAPVCGIVERVDRRSAAAAGERPRIAADALLVAHLLLAAFVTGGLLLVWLGAAAGWRWIRNPWFRYLHLAAIGIVALEALLGVACPLTVWEDLLRGGLQAQSFVGRWVQRLLYYDAPERLFTALYAAWALATLVTLRFVPPRKKTA